MDSIWSRELKRFSGLVKDEQIAWLANLMFLLTVFARDTYSADGSDVDDPIRLRRFNELVHRLTSQQLKIASDDKQRFLEPVLFEMIEEELSALDVDSEYVLNKLS